MRKKVLMVVYNQIQFDARVMRSAEALSEADYLVEVISCNSDTNFQSKHFHSTVIRTLSKGKLCFIEFMIRSLWMTLFKKKKYDIFYTHDYFLVAWGWVVKNIKRKSWVYDAHELLIEHKHKSARSLLFFLVEKTLIHRADFIFAANYERMRIMKFVYKIEQIDYVLNIAPHNTYTIPPKKDIIVYQGVVSEERGIIHFIHLLEYLPDYISLRVLGDGPTMMKCKDYVNEKKLSGRVAFLGKIPYNDLIAMSLECKIGILCYAFDDLNNFYCSPNKVYEYAQMKIAILASRQPFLSKIVELYNIGETFSKDYNYEEMAKNVLLIMNNHEKYIEGVDPFLMDYSFKNEKTRFISNMNKIK